MQAALDTHSLPDDVEFVHVSRSSIGVFVIVQAAHGPCPSGRGATVQEAYDDAMAQRDLAQQQRCDAVAREKARTALVAAGLSPELLAKG